MKILFLSTLIGAALLATPTISHSDSDDGSSTNCDSFNPLLSGMTYGKVVVPAGESCVVDNTAGGLITINGNFSATGAHVVDLRGFFTINGDVKLKESTGAIYFSGNQGALSQEGMLINGDVVVKKSDSSDGDIIIGDFPGGLVINGDVKIRHNIAPLVFVFNTEINGGVVLSHNEAVVMGVGFFKEINGDIRLEDNKTTGDMFVLGRSQFLGGDDSPGIIRGNILLKRNISGEDVLALAFDQQSGDVVIKDNTAVGNIGAGCFDQISGDLHVVNNTATQASFFPLGIVASGNCNDFDPAFKVTDGKLSGDLNFNKNASQSTGAFIVFMDISGDATVKGNSAVGDFVIDGNTIGGTFKCKNNNANLVGSNVGGCIP